MRNQSVLREGTTAGIIGATAVAAWFLVVDLVVGHAFYTPDILGRALLSILGPDRQDSTMLVVGLYTIFHYAAFIVAGIIAAAIIRVGRRQAAILAGALILFVVFEIGFYGFTALLSESAALGTLAWFQVGIANLIATALMGIYFWRGHPGLGTHLDFALSGRDEHAPQPPRAGAR